MGNAIPDIPRINTAIAEWLSCMVALSLLPPRHKKATGVFLVLAALGIWVAYMVLTANITLWLWIPCMMGAFGMMVCFIHFCSQTGWWKSMYFGTISFIIAECMASLQWQIVNYCFCDVAERPIWAEDMLLVGIYGLFALGARKMMRFRLPPGGRLQVGRKDGITALFIGIVVFGFSNLSFVTADTPFSGQYSQEIANVRTLVDVAGLAIIYAHYILCCENMVRHELAAVQNVLQNQYQQYKQARESVDLINIKYHDMKHQIQYLRTEQDTQKRNAFLDQMEQDIRQYELQNKTGNPVIDTLLTSKSLYCAKHGITLTCVADGKLLSFMSTMDLCSIFGNALDNATESVLKIKDKEKRLIHVTVARMNEFVMIRVENYYEGKLRAEAGHFLSTKQDAENHGYGIRSIRYTAEHYDGVVQINAENNWFDLKILIPYNN